MTPATSDDLELDIPPRSTHTPTEALIRANYRRLGCDKWGRDRFLRLARALNETPEELGARIGLKANATRKCMDNDSFTLTQGILLELHWRFIEQVATGLPPSGELIYAHRPGSS